MITINHPLLKSTSYTCLCTFMHISNTPLYFSLSLSCTHKQTHTQTHPLLSSLLLQGKAIQALPYMESRSSIITIYCQSFCLSPSHLKPTENSQLLEWRYVKAAILCIQHYDYCRDFASRKKNFLLSTRAYII